MITNTRIAPSPSGDMHLGTVRTAYFNWLIARATGGSFTLRIDDTNQEKSSEEHVQVILDTMEWLGLDYDHVFRQSERYDRYRERAKELLDRGIAILDDGAVKLVTEDVPEEWADEAVGRLKVSSDDQKSARETILLRSDGSPTYHWASVCDDADFVIDLICRGVDHISNTPRQIAIFRAIRAPLPRFAHVGLLHQAKRKLSKSDGAAGVLQYRKAGYHPEAILNFVLRMGWGPKIDDKTSSIIDRSRAIELFVKGGNLRSAAANIDFDKLNWYDRKYKARNDERAS